MCTGFIKKGNDLIVGFNLDLAKGAWDYRVYAKSNMFYIGIKVGSTVYKTHGVNKNGNFANLPYMNDLSKGTYRRGCNYQRLDLLVDGYISGKNTYNEILDVISRKNVVNIPNNSMHSLIADSNGRILLIEPGLGFEEIHRDFAVISNFPLLEEPKDISAAWYGKDRYDKGVEILKSCGDNFSAYDGMNLLKAVRQEGEWATRVSFVYSQKESAVYYSLENDFSEIIKHTFK